MSAKYTIQSLLQETLEEMISSENILSLDNTPPIHVERPKNPEHGDYSCNLAFQLAPQLKKSPQVIGELIISILNNRLNKNFIESVTFHPPGFINFKLTKTWIATQVNLINDEGILFGNSNLGKQKKVQVEFVSVNPTGPIHVGHLRGAVYGSALANILKAAGYEVETEYYINDAGTQIDNFSLSIFVRYKELYGETNEFPKEGYHGEYIKDLALLVSSQLGDKLLKLSQVEACSKILSISLTEVLNLIKSDMTEMNVTYDNWFSERSLYESQAFDRIMELLKSANLTKKKDGAIWFLSSNFGDDKDKVLIRKNGTPTYFASDVAYHWNKFNERHFDWVIDIWGADHHGHVPFMNAILKALNIPHNKLSILLYQLVTLKRNNETVRVSKRTGNVITLKELINEVGTDPCRYFFLSRAPDTQMDFDIHLAKQQSNENPVYYIQYAYARCSSVLGKAAAMSIDFNNADVSLLNSEKELSLIQKMLDLPELIEMMSLKIEPHKLPHYTLELAGKLHLFYETCRIITSIEKDIPLMKSRLKLTNACAIVLKKCLQLMEMKAPNEM